MTPHTITPPIVNPPIANPPVVSPPVATPPIVTPPIVTDVFGLLRILGRDDIADALIGACTSPAQPVPAAAPAADAAATVDPGPTPEPWWVERVPRAILSRSGREVLREWTFDQAVAEKVAADDGQPCRVRAAAETALACGAPLRQQLSAPRR